MFVSQIFEECAEILGTTDKPKVFRKISQAVQTLMESGHWMQSTAEVDVCTGWDGCSIALPRGVSVPLAVNVDGSPTYFRNRLFQYHVNKGGMFNPVEWAWDDRGYVATLMEIIQPSELVAIAESSNDVGKVIRVVGTNDTNRPIRSQLADGTGVDGLLIPINSPSDFAFGTISPSDSNIATREVSITPIQSFKSASPHQLNSGQAMSITPITGTIPVPLSDGKIYYIGVIDALTIKIFNDSLNAQSGDYPISLQSIVDSGPLKFLDERASRVVTALRFSEAPTIGISNANPIVFPENQTLPVPLKSKTTYFGNLLDSTNLQIFKTEDNAKNNYDEIYITGILSPINVDVRKEIAPETKLTFEVPHLFLDGDQVVAFTSGGVLPKPLILNKNYYVNVIDSKTITLHENKYDAENSNTTSFVNPIVCTTPPTGLVSLVKLIPATSVVGTSNQITAPGLSIPTPSGLGAQFTAVPVGSVTGVRVSASGSGYTTEPKVTFSDPPVAPSGQQYETAKGYAIRNTITNTISEVIITDPGAGYSSPPTVIIDPPTTAGYAVTNITTAPSGSLQAKVTTAIPHGFANNSQVLISGAFPNDYNGVKTITLIDGTNFRYSVSSDLPDATGNITASAVAAGNQASATASITTSFISRFTKNSGGSGYTIAPQVKIEGGGGTGATAKANIAGGQVTSIDIITQGSGYTSAPNVTITPSTGVFIEFQSTGTLPQPLIAGTAYRAENPASNTFTVKGTDYSDIDIKSSGSGTLYVVLSRTFGVSFTGNWIGDYASLPDVQGFYFGTDFSLPTTSPTIDNGVTKFWFKKFTDKSAKVYLTENDAINAGTTGQVVATAFGTGQAYFGIRFTVTPTVYDNLIEPDNIEFISGDEIVNFNSSGTLPNPLVSGTNYTVKLFGNRVKVYQGGTLISITTPGTGRLTMDILREMIVQPSTSIYAPACLYETGDKISVRAEENDVLPNGLVAGTLYYVRKIDADEFELYDTLANSKNLSSTNGRVKYLTSGNKTTSKFFVDSIQGPVLVKSISNIEKPKTDGYVSLYAFDYGRSNDMTLIGQYHPDEINPSYRRIRIGKKCAWARIAYRLTPPTVTSMQDYIPIEHERSIITAVHACDLEDKDFADQAVRYWGVAFNYLKNQQEHLDGHAFQPPQIQNLVYADGEEPVMF